MKRFNRNNNQIILKMNEDLSVQSLSVQKSDARMEFRLPGNLKELIELVSDNKNKSVSELTILLWLDYLSKAKYISGEVVNTSNIDLKADVEDFLKRTSRKAV